MKLKTKFRFYQKVSIAIVVLMINQIVFPVAALALTSGPTQPEVSDFEPVGTSQMVDLFSGDFTYNIPMFELPGPDGGYPFNLAYHSGISMDQEASWVGLGWTLNHGAITRNMRGLPDDFNGDLVEKKLDMRPNRTWDFRLKSHLEFWGYEPGQGGSGNLNLSLALSVSHNSYKGWGLGAGINIGTNFFQDSDFAFNGGLGLDVSSFDGADIKPNLSFGNAKGKLGRLELASSINSREGLNNFSLGYSKKSEALSKLKDKKGRNVTPTSVGGNANYTFAKTAYSPQVGMGYSGFNFTGSVELGGWTTVAGIGGVAEVSFNRQRLKDRNTWVSAPAFGYMHMHNRGNDDGSLMDFNRSKDGAISKSQPNLAIPMTTPDIYSVMGQGIGSMYRPYRSDIGILSDPYVQSKGGGGTLGAEVDPGFGFDLGLDLGGNWSSSSTNNWNVSGTLGNTLAYDQDAENEKNYEPYYFRSGGEMTGEKASDYNFIGKDKAVRLKLGSGSNRLNYDGAGKFEYLDNGSFTINQGKRNTRKPRSSSIQPITNRQVMFNVITSREALNEYDVKYYNAGESLLSPPTHDLPRDFANHPDHIAGMTALQPSGMRYVYALPVKNKEQQEISYSFLGSGGSTCGPTVDISASGSDINYSGGTNRDDYLNITKFPEFTHSYMLTSVLGADYADVDNIPGPSDGDYGYWVKFNYVKTSDYKWKAPYHGANFIEGNKSTARDDKASFLYGEREQYYLASAETKTHIAEFNISTRPDGRGSANIFQNNNSGSANANAAYSYQLDKISIFSKLEASGTRVPMKEAHFTYNNNLCQNVDNNYNNGSGDGKLTLESVHFTYENSTRGALSPYRFDYGNYNSSVDNPTYDTHKYDRWGNYKANATNVDCESQDFPYTDQFLNQEDMDEMASAWHLKEITMPSGARINVDYEADDYAYVQDRTAMQMFKIKGVGNYGTANNDLFPDENPSENQRRVYFDLEHNIAVGEEDLFKKYFDDLHSANKNNGAGGLLYYKILTDINDANNEEYVSGYAEVEKFELGTPSGGQYTNGYVVLKPSKIGKKNNKKNYHPFLASSWQKLKLDFPDKLSGKSMDYDDGSFKQAIGKFKSAFGEIKNIFKSYYKHCSDEEFATELNLPKSFIRLNTPDKIKYGGGVRVKQVTLNDNWDIGEDGVADTPTYGQVYEYTTTDEDGTEISSGVAINEPSIGYDECALRFAKKWTNEVFLKSEEISLFEYPINESYFPGAAVGYSKVTVKSLATEYSLMDPVDRPADLPDGFSSTGVAVNEFYTAKDFPILVQETELDNRVGSPKWVPFGIGSYRSDKYTGSQGYAITLNDMHGKPYKITQYAQDKNNVLIDDPLSQVIYTYAEDELDVHTVAGEKRVSRVLNNMVDVLIDDVPGSMNAQIEQQQLGVDYEFFMDMRETKANTGSVYVGVNVDYVPLFIFGVSGWPRVSISESQTRTAVTNKIIQRSGILKRVDAYDGQSHIVTQNKVFDKLTGQVLLSSVNNSFDDQIYNYQIPARFAYERMGAAYENWGTKFTATLAANSCAGPSLWGFSMTNVSNDIRSILQEGDQIIFNVDNAACDDPTSGFCTRGMGYIESINGNTIYFKLKDLSSLSAIVSAVNVECMIVRSGKRNHLSAMAGNITAMSNPTQNRTPRTNINAAVPLPNGSTASTTNVSVSYSEMDSVINASVTTYSDNWDLGRVDCSANIAWPFEDGTRGVWRPNRSFAYVTDRTPTNPTPGSSVDLSIDGVYHDLPMFNWTNPFFGFLTEADQWKMSNEMTQYGINGDEVENRNILGQYSAGLYAYNDNLPIAVGSNTAYCEMGFESFEEFPTQIDPANGSMLLGDGNIDFAYLFSDGAASPPVIGSVSKKVTKKYSMVAGFVNSTNTVWIDKPFDANAKLPNTVKLQLYNPAGEDFSVEYPVTGQVAFNANLAPPNFLYQGDLTGLSISNNGNCNLPSSGTYTGYATLVYCNTYDEVPNCDGPCTEANTTDRCVNPCFLELIDAIDCMFQGECEPNGGGYAYCEAVGATCLDGVFTEDDNEHDIEVVGLSPTAGFSLLVDNIHFRHIDTDALVNNLCEIVDLDNPRVDLTVSVSHYLGIVVDVTYDDNSVETIAFSDASNATGFHTCTGNGGSLIANGESTSSQTLKKRTGKELITGKRTKELTKQDSLRLQQAWLNQGRKEVPANFRDGSSSTDCESLGAITQITSNIAHTGENSFLVNEDVSFEQKSMMLTTGKEYIIGAWVHRPNLDSYTFDDGTLGLQIEMDGATPVVFAPQGEVIEGWQRIEGRFTFNGSHDWVLTFNVGTSAANFDDLRIYPLTGNMQTYVYDPIDYRLTALLDNNNYATFYHYDEEGNLFLLKKETERGVKTIQESKKHIKPN